jgi:DGQHR domain-containing protein
LVQINTKTGAILEVVAIRLNQHGRELYQFSLPASEIRDLITSGSLDIDRWSPKEQDGYQRIPTESRYKRFGKYVAVQKGITPVSMLISLREKDNLQVKELGDEGAVRLRIGLEGGKLYIPDGQHRAYGLKWAVDQYPGEADDYQLPVVLFVANGGDARYEEAQQFYTINNNAKRVKTDLAQRYLLRERERDLGALNEETAIPPDATMKELEPYAVKIADILNESGPLEGMIAPPNMDAPSASISQTSFVDSIKPLLQTASKLHWDVRKTKGTLNAFWSAVNSKVPEAMGHWSDDACDETDEEHFDAVLATTSGMFSLNDVLNRTMLLPEVAAAPTSPETFKKLLNKPSLEDFFSDGPEGYWASESPMSESAAGHGTSRKSFKEIADAIWDETVGA